MSIQDIPFACYIPSRSDLNLGFGPTSALDNAILRNTPAPGLARYFQEQLERTSYQDLTGYLADAIDSGAVPPRVVHVFLSVCKEPRAIFYALIQSRSVLARRIAIRHFIRQCRSDSFRTMWNNVGRSFGMLVLMSTMSVSELDLLCRSIGKCASARDPIQVRQCCFSKFLEDLRNTGGKQGCNNRNLDSRSLHTYYDKIVPACLPDDVFQGAFEGLKLKGTVCQANLEDYEPRFLDIVFTPGRTITPFKFVLEGSTVDFSLKVLRRLSVTPTTLKANAENLVEDLIRPLARRLCNRKGCHLLQIDLYRLVIECINKEPSIANALDYSIISYAIKAWNRAHERQDVIRDLLKTLLGLMKEEHQWTLDRIAKELKRVRPGLRFPLLQVLLQNARPFKVDISSASIKELGSLSNAWPPRLFYLLPSGIALRFFQLLRTAHPCDKFIAADKIGSLGGIIRVVDCHSRTFGDPEIISALLHLRHYGSDSSNATWLTNITNVLEVRKSNAVSMQDAEERAKWAHLAVLLSIASGSLELYEETILWAQQFNRDNHVVMRLFSTSTLFAQEGLDLLSGIPHYIADHEQSLAQLGKNVVRANRILMQYMKMASTCRRDPSFGICDEGILSNLQLLPSKIIWRRARLLDALQESAGLSDNEIYSSVWRSSIDMLMEFERFNLQDEHNHLYSKTLKGPLTGSPPMDDPKAHLCKFLDELGKSRDKFWQEHRSKTHPKIADIGAPWPRGLPIQYLIPAVPSAWTNMPYLESRARAILFAPRETLLDPLPTDRETIAAIEPFVDNFIFALRIFISAVDEGPERDGRIRQIWDHAMTELTCKCISQKEALWYWKHFFGLVPGIALPDSIAAAFEILNLEFPSKESSTAPVEWNPSRTTMHSSPRPQSSWCSDSIYSRFGTLTPENIYAGKVLSIWDFQGSLKNYTQSQKDAMAAAAIDFLNAKYGMGSSLFTSPFPSLEDPRFPALYLSKEFLEGQGDSVTSDSVLRILGRLSASVPTQLLRRLTRSIWKRLNANESINYEVLTVFLKVVGKLAQGDSPQDACEFVRMAILKYQGQGPFRRYPFNVDFLSRLRSCDVRDFFHGYCYDIKNKLRLQQRAIISRKKKNKSTELPLIAARTVELAAQLACENKFLWPEFARESLVCLLKDLPHTDMQITIMESLRRILSNTDRKDIQLSIIKSLKEHMVPIAASLDERRPLSEAEWARAEAGEAPLPDVYEGDSALDLPPIMKFLVRAIPKPDTTEKNVGQTCHGRWMRRIILPTLKLSAINHQRWTALFLKANGFDLDVKSLPLVPLNPRLLAELFGMYPKVFPSSTFKRIKDVVKININPGDNIALINEAVRGNFELLQSNARKHWLSTWNTTESALNLGAHQCTDLLFDRTMNTTKKALGGATIKGLKAFIWEIAELYISTSDVVGYNAFLSELDFPGRIYSPETHAFFKSNCLPFLKGFIAKINSLENSDWHCSSNRQPWQLPETWTISLQILRGKHWHQSPEIPTAPDIRDFVRDVTLLIAQLSKERYPSYKAWIRLRQAALQPFHKKHFFPVALEIGSMIENLEAPDRAFAARLLFDLVVEFISGAEDPEDENLIIEIERFLGSWKNNPDKYIGEKTELLIKRLSAG
ncbi:hypothetical protein F5Y13DRAFT_202238 [Hypoxylon sp. FL1857]|nr:hypothetical protein F5Y13DRAFT_202238 [Hypoxylon sp. FL1857]